MDFTISKCGTSHVLTITTVQALTPITTEILGKILLSGMPAKYMALPCKEWFMIVCRELFG